MQIETTFPKINLISPEIRANPYPTYKMLRDNFPVFSTRIPLFGDAWLITRYEDVQNMLSDPRLVSDRRNIDGKQGDESPWWMPNVFEAMQDGMITRDEPDHRRLRKLVHLAFTPKRVAQLETRMQEITDELLDNAQKQNHVDLLEAFALQLPLIVISDMLGVPEKDRHNFHVWSAKFIDSVGGSPLRMLTAIPSANKMFKFFDYLIDLRTKKPGDDMTTAMLQAEVEGDRLTREEVISMLFLLYVAGHETTVNLIASGTLALLETPDAFHALRENPDLFDPAVEEIIRYANPVEQIAPRFAKEDFVFHGQRIERGKVVLISVASANRDERVFDNPDTFDIYRSPNRHLGFGYGIHYCLGAPLARLEGKVALQTLLTRFPNLRLAVPPEKLSWRSAINVRGVKRLPVIMN